MCIGGLDVCTGPSCLEGFNMFTGRSTCQPGGSTRVSGSLTCVTGGSTSESDVYRGSDVCIGGLTVHRGSDVSIGGLMCVSGVRLVYMESDVCVLVASREYLASAI